MTREKAREVSDLYFKLERYENLIDEIKALPGLAELTDVFDDTKLEDKLVAVVRSKIDAMLRQLEEM